MLSYTGADGHEEMHVFYSMAWFDAGAWPWAHYLNEWATKGIFMVCTYKVFGFSISPPPPPPPSSFWIFFRREYYSSSPVKLHRPPQKIRRDCRMESGEQSGGVGARPIKLYSVPMYHFPTRAPPCFLAR